MNSLNLQLAIDKNPTSTDWDTYDSLFQQTYLIFVVFHIDLVVLIDKIIVFIGRRRSNNVKFFNRWSKETFFLKFL